MRRLLNHDPEDVTPYVRWDKTGRLLIIPDEKALVENVCKVHFAQKNITSFVRRPFPPPPTPSSLSLVSEQCAC